ncbi:hypothetical protein D3C78_1430400 [compost metagenome]
MGGVFGADANAERHIATQVGKQRAVLFVRVVAQGCAKTAAEYGQAAVELLAVEGIDGGVAVVDQADFITQGLVEGLFKAYVGIDLKVGG